MTDDQPQAADQEKNGSTPGGSAAADEKAGGSTAADEKAPHVVIRDNRKIDQAVEADEPSTPVDGDNTDTSVEGLVEEVEVVVDEVTETPEAEPEPAGPAVVDAPTEPVTDEAVEKTGPLGAELESVRSELDERTRDLQRVSAEYANYRKRVDRDRSLVTEQATASVLTALLPILDDLDRAREHGDLVGPFGTVAEQLIGTLGKFGLTTFGEQGDPFDPTRHEAVAHQTSADVTEPTCVQIMRRGYLAGDRLLRPALVAVADPE